VFLFKTRSNKEREELYDYYGALKYKKKDFFKALDYATKDPYSFLMIKLEGKDAPQYYRSFQENITDKFSINNNIEQEQIEEEDGYSE
jgi:hypothetical protein